MAEDNMYLENLKEFVFEEDKIVTYKWLSRTLAVNVNQAKQMLFTFAQNTHEQQCLNVTYIIGGVIKNDNGQYIKKYLFANEPELKVDKAIIDDNLAILDMKKCFDQLTTLHIYSVQKNQLKNSNALYTLDYDLQKQNLECSNRWSNITCNSAVFEASNYSNEGHLDNFEDKEPISNGLSKKVTPVSPEPVKPQSKPMKSASAKPDKSKNKTMKKGDVASFFAKQANNSKETCSGSAKDTELEEKNEEKEDKKENRNNKDVKIKKDDASEPPQVNVKKSEKMSVENEDKKRMNKLETETEKSVEKMDTDQGEKKKRKKSPKSKTVGEDKREEKAVKRNKSKTSSDEKKTGDGFENKRKGKKRRRVKEFSESSDDEEVTYNKDKIKLSGGSEDSVPIPDQQLQQNKTTEGSNNSETKRRKRKRVLKSKTFLNDDGYMVTEKVYESESTDCSDVEEKPKITVNENVNKTTTIIKNTTQKPSVKKKPVTKATKQSSLTSFFKKA